MKSKRTTKRSVRKVSAPKKKMARMTFDEAMSAVASGEDHTDWARIAAMTEEEIEANAQSDPDNPPISDALLSAGKLVMPPEDNKVPISFRVDPDILAFFRQGGRGYQSRMNAALRAWIIAHKIYR